MKKNYFYIILIIMVFASCKTQKPITDGRTIEKHVTTLVPVYLPSDSALLKAYLECDSTNRVILKSFSETKSGRIESDLSLENNVLNYKTRTIRDTIYITSDTIYTYKEVPLKIETEKIVYRMTKTQQFFFYAGIIAFTALAVWLILKINFKELLNRILKLFKQ